MKRFSQIYLSLLIVFMILWALPWAYNFLFARPNKTPFVLYSSLLHDFLLVEYSEANGHVRRDRHNNRYTEAQTDSLLPTFYMRLLVSNGRWPDTLMGQPVAPHDVQRTNFNFRAMAADINAPRVPLYFLQEAMPRRAELEMPSDVMRFTAQGVEFVDMTSNTIDPDKSLRYTKALTAKGFAFPPRYVAGNPSTHKDYDNGLLLLDARQQLFHLKQLRGRPYVQPVAVPDSVRLRHLFVTEFRDRQLLGLLTDSCHRLFALRADSYELVRTGVDGYDPEQHNMTIFGNMFDWTVRIAQPQTERYMALDATTLQLLDTLSIATPRSHAMPGMSFRSSTNPRIRPRWQ
ncbi:MAG: DUF4857 domain-containing protein [Bacteroidales bacterium]|nr:DUF4857 domain-containing protein [Bacteroidales bacterium]